MTNKFESEVNMQDGGIWLIDSFPVASKANLQGSLEHRQHFDANGIMACPRNLLILVPQT